MRRSRGLYLLLAGALLAALWRRRLQEGCFAGPSVPRLLAVSHKPGLTWLRALQGEAEDATAEDATWKDAYQLEVDRNGLLREQLQDAGLTSLLIDSVEVDLAKEPEACESNWEQNYEALAACNQALEKQLRSQRVGTKTFQDRRDVEAERAAMYKIKLSNQDSAIPVELPKCFGLSSAFYLVRAQLPLGLKLSKSEQGYLMGTFVVEGVIPGGSAEASGNILKGDVLHALTFVEGAAGLGSRSSEYQEFLGTMIGMAQKPKQKLVLSVFLNTIDDLVDAIKSNSELGEDAELTLIFERDTELLPPPDVLLEPSE